MTITRRDFFRLAGTAGATIACGGALAGGLAGCSVSRATRTVTDMAGRSVNVPETISRVFCTNPIGTVDLYGLDPDLLVGWNFLPAGDNRTYIDDAYLDLPSLGVWMGAGSQPNAEEIASQDPDALLCYWTADDAGSSMADSIAEQTGLPVLLVDYDLRNAADSYRFVGELCGVQDRAEELAAYCEQKKQVIEGIAAQITDSERKSIFLAQGLNGLSTDPVGSMHVTDALALLNTDNVADLPGTVGQGMGMPTVNLEQIIEWDPDAVLVSEYSMSDAESSDTYSEILADAHWANVPCVASGEVFRIPQSPFSWFGRPPSAVRMLGCLWLAKILYPGLAQDINLRQEAIDFYRMFYRYDLGEDRLAGILESAGIDPETGERKNAGA